MTNLDKILSVKNEELNKIQTFFISKYDFHHDISYFHAPSGAEHYRLLIYIASLYKDETLCDVGTNRCMSAAALSGYNKVKSYDVIKIHDTNPNIPNVEWIIGDIREDNIMNVPFIFMDVDHDGIFENLFYEHLKDIKWKGLLMLDDIHLNEPMKKFYNRIEEPKYDISYIGHWSGTSIVNFA